MVAMPVDPLLVATADPAPRLLAHSDQVRHVSDDHQILGAVNAGLVH